VEEIRPAHDLSRLSCRISQVSISLKQALFRETSTTEPCCGKGAKNCPRAPCAGDSNLLQKESLGKRQKRSNTEDLRRASKPVLVRVAVLGVVFGLSSDSIGMPLGRWTYQIPALAPLIWATLWPSLFLLLPRRFNRYLEYFLVGIIGLSAELVLIGLGFLTYLVRTSFVLNIGSRWAPLAVCGWPFSAVMFFVIAVDFHERIRSKVGSARALLFSAALMTVMNMLLTIAYIFGPV